MTNNQSISMDQMNAKINQLYRKLYTIEQKIETKADDIVLTMLLNQRNDLEQLQSDIVQIKKEISRSPETDSHHIIHAKANNNTKKRIKVMPFPQKT
ncbi:hypothetical protein [Paraliobacillus salinarum]|uniref:hypothetical protein n=1 Tax=Paraliobacillus salinarum TaxID=1158996 RepID=UPI0015F72205|nr:hypothetical protein [Paraliobacillus salinarum]